MKSKMTDDELSELAEALDNACQEWTAAGGVIEPRDRGETHQCACPFGAHIDAEDRYPGHTTVIRLTRLPRSVVVGFIRGFDGYDPFAESTTCRLRALVEATSDDRAVELGGQFRRRYGPEGLAR